MIADITGVPVAQQILYYDARNIVNGDRLAVYEFEARGVINLVGKFKGGKE
jgi:hypothetical protein